MKLNYCKSGKDRLTVAGHILWLGFVCFEIELRSNEPCLPCAIWIVFAILAQEFSDKSGQISPSSAFSSSLTTSSDSDSLGQQKRSQESKLIKYTENIRKHFLNTDLQAWL